MTEAANHHLNTHIMQDDHSLKSVDGWTLGIFDGDDNLIETWVVRGHY